MVCSHSVSNASGEMPPVAYMSTKPILYSERIMVSRELSFGELELTISEDYDNDTYDQYPALIHQKQIIETARILNALGNELAGGEPVLGKPKVEAYFDAGGVHSGLQSVISTVDTLLEWLEQSGNRAMKDLKKREAVLRGVLRLTELGSQASFIGMLEFACKFLDVPDDPYPAEREYITNCLAEIEQQKQRILRITERAGDILKTIIDAEKLDITKEKQFDNVMREGILEIDSCRRRLDGANKMILELMRKMQAVRWFSRGFRAVGLGVSCYFFYHKYQESTISLSLLLVSCLASAVVWLSLFPSRAYVFHASLSKLNAKHRLLTEGLDDVYRRLESSNVYKDKLTSETRRINDGN